ncbi:MAG: hypothetical protein U9R39_01980 [Campylobacterota bacterium]|nr:hypothetical protein [Campylobacterota bacterium]
MQVYIYAKSGHSFGLENVRRASVLCNVFKDSDPILCTADYRAATFAKSELGINRGVGIDVIGNLPHVMERGDILIYDDSKEASSTMQDHMKDFCTHLYKVGEDIPFDIVDETFTNDMEIQYEKGLFFSDDDYEEWFLNLCEDSTKQELSMIMGHYFFLGNEDKLKPFFDNIIEEEDYIEAVKTTKYLLTACVQTCMESLASGNCPVYFKRGDKETIENIELLDKYNIPTVTGDNLDEIVENFNLTIKNYPKIKEIEKFDFSAIKKDINDTLKKFAMIQPSLDYKYTS